MTAPSSIPHPEEQQEMSSSKSGSGVDQEVAPAVASSDPGIELKELLREFDDAWGEYGCWLSDRTSTPFRFDRIQAARSAIKHYVASLRAEVESQHEYRHALILARNYWRKEATVPWRTEIKVSIPLPAGMQDLSEMEMDYIKAKANQALDQLTPEEAAKAIRLLQWHSRVKGVEG